MNSGASLSTSSSHYTSLLNMATEGGKIKAKRRTAPSKPYERNLTLFGKLRKSVKELLIPSWLSGSYQESERLGTGDAYQTAQTLPAGECNNVVSGVQLHHKAGDGHAAMVQQSAAIGEQTRQPAALHDLRGQGEGSIPTLGEITVDDHRAGRVPHVNSMAVTRRGKSATDRKNTSSTSRFGDELHQPASPRVQLIDTEDQSSGPHPIMTSTRVLNQSTDFSNPAAKRQKLWSPESERQGKYFSTPVHEKPAFNSTLLGSVSNSSMLGDSFHNSLFYPGKTRFGGAAAEKRTSLNTSLPYQSSLPLRKQVRPHNMRNNINATTSATAQRILETLDRMSTPLGDAKKIPMSDNDSVLSFTPSSYRRTSFHMGRPATRPLQLPSRGPPTSQHQVLAQAVIAKNRHTSSIVDKRHNSSVIDDNDDENDNRSVSIPVSQEARALLNRIQPSVSSETGGSLGHKSQTWGSLEHQCEASGKIKAKRFTQHISNAGVDSDVVEVPHLRTEFTLPISNMRPISLQPVQTLTVAAPPADDTVPIKFIFSAPIDEKRQACSQMSSGVSDKNFKFTSPIKTSQTKTSAAGAEGESKNCQEPAVGASSGMPMWTSSSLTASVPAWGSVAPKPKMASPDIGGTSSSFKSYNKWGGFEKPDDSSAASDTPAGFSVVAAATLKTGSVMDILGGGKSSSVVSSPATTSSTAKDSILPGTEDLMAKFKKAAGSWECDACMLVNKPEASKCICCDTAKPGAKPSGSGTTTASSSSSTVPGTSSSLESSATSMRPSDSVSSTLSNKESATLGGTGISPDNSLSALFKKPAGSWECDTCLVQNTATAVRCLACDSSKPGLQTAGIVSKPSVSSSSSAITISPAGGFTFNVSATTSGSAGFKFGNASSLTSSSSTPTATGFVFGQATSANRNSESSTGSTSSTLLTGGFKFGATGSDGGGVSSVSSGLGQVFAGSSASISAVKTNTGALAEAKMAAFDTSAATSSAPSNGIPLTGDNKSNSSTTFQAATNPNGAVQFGTALVTKDSNTKLSQQVSFNFAPVSSAAASALVAPSTHQPVKSDSAASKLTSSLFQFGASSVVPAASTGLGMGNSLADSKPVLNGGFGAQAGKDSSGAASVDTSKSLANFTFGTNQPPPTFASFGQASAATSGSLVPQTAQSGKRTVDFSEADHSGAKKSFNFGTSSNDVSSNGLFTFGGSAESKTCTFAVSSTASSSTGGFVLLNSTSNPPANQAGGPTPSGGFQFSPGSSTAPGFQGFNFSLKPPNDTPKLASFEAPALTGATSFNTTASFNFSSATQPNSVFQFGAKPAESSAATSGLFTFGAAHTAAASPDSFGTAASVVTPGAFNIGTGNDPSRKFKKAIRRTKK